MVEDLHMSWPNHAKISQATTFKVALMKDALLNRSRDFWLYHIISWQIKKAYATFAKAVRHQICRKNTENNIFIL